MKPPSSMFPLVVQPVGTAEMLTFALQRLVIDQLWSWRTNGSISI